MWREGNLGIPDGKGGYTVCHFWAKVYDRPSRKYGINGSRIIKLTIKVKGKVTANYDRGWDIEPTDEATEKAVQLLLFDVSNEGALLRRKLTTTCYFRSAWDDKGDERYPKSELCYIRAYHDGDQWCSTVFPINWELKTEKLAREADSVYAAFRKAFPDLKAVRSYVEHEAEKLDDPTEGNAYLEMEHGVYWLRMITRKGDYNLYLHVLSRAAMAGGGNREED